MTTKEVELTGGAPWGFRMHGGADHNQPLRISRSYSYPERELNVNPGRKASLSGIREGDVISSINGQTTRAMSNSDAHAMLRSAGPVLRLGLNEDKEMSPRRRSIGRASDLRRSSHLLSEINNDVAIPQAPVYATIRPAKTSQHRPPLQQPSSLSSLPAALNSTEHIKSLTPKEEPIQFHPTNPFYTTLPSNYSSASKLPVPNGRASLSGLDRSRSQNKFKDNVMQNEHDSDLRSPSYFSLMNDSGPHSTIFSNNNDTGNTNGYKSETLKLPRSNKDSPFVRDSNLKIHEPSCEIKLNEKNPFKMKRNSDPFDKFLRSNIKNDDNFRHENSTIPISISDSDLHKNEQEINRKSVTEHKVNETEEIKTIKKIVMNGSADNGSQDHVTMFKNVKLNSENTNYNINEDVSPVREHYIKVQYSPQNENANGKSNVNFKNYEASYDKYRKESTISTENQSQDERGNIFSPADTPNQSVATKPPLKSPSAPAAPHSLSKQTVMIAPTFRARSTSPAVWRPGAPAPSVSPGAPVSPGGPVPTGAGAAASQAPPPPPPPVWSPAASPQAPRKPFRPVHFEDTPPARRKFINTEQNGCTSGSESEGRLRTSLSAPAAGLSALGATSRLPRVQNPTVTLLQKARENHLSRASNIQERDPRLPRDRPSPPIGDPVHALRKGYLSEGEADRREYHTGSRKMADANRKVEGIGPTTKEGMPVALRSEVKDPTRWYKKMYDTIHKNKYDDDYVTIRYKNRQGQPPLRVSSSRSQYAYFDPRSGYLSEPEGGLGRLSACDAYDSDVTTGHRRRTASVQEDRRDDFAYLPNNKYSTLASARASQEVYKSQPGRIENYVPGKSSVVDKEAKQWWDEVMDIFDGWLDDNSPLPPYTTLLARAIQKSQNISSTTSLPQTSPKEKKDVTATILSKSNMARALKESGYESDSTLIFRRREETDGPLSPAERRAAYKDLQAGGEPPLRGFRSPAPPRQENDPAPEPPRRVPHGSYSDTESPSRRYVEGDVNIHYRCPVRREPLPLVPERELARHQAEHMKRLYRDQKRHKYLQEKDIHLFDIEAFDASIKELQDMQNRRHQDNFMPSQKTVVPLNRYDEAEKLVARALYAFSGQTPRELTFKKGDLINVRRQIDSNWYEGEVHGRIGLFPYNYVEILKGDTYTHSPKKPVAVEGQARAKFDFTAQTNLELPLKKGEVVVLTRRIDHNWWEGRNGTKTGIFPDSYVTVLQEPSQAEPPAPQNACNVEKPAASPAAHGLVNGSARRSLQQHSYTPQHNSPALSNAPPATAPLPGSGYLAKPGHVTLAPSERGYGAAPAGDLNNAEPLYVDTNAEAVPYRAMYKYRPQNPDELELQEGDTVYVLEKCDDGWYVGSSQRTGRFGTFPGNYVERI